jgi:hypothetical protein
MKKNCQSDEWRESPHNSKGSMKKIIFFVFIYIAPFVIASTAWCIEQLCRERNIGRRIHASFFRFLKSVWESEFWYGAAKACLILMTPFIFIGRVRRKLSGASQEEQEARKRKTEIMKRERKERNEYTPKSLRHAG